MTDDMTVDHQMRMRRLQSLELHGVTPETGIEIEVVKHPKGMISLGYISEDDEICVAGYIEPDRPNSFMVMLDGDWDDYEIPTRDLDAWIALLQKAREIMQNGGG